MVLHEFVIPYSGVDDYFIVVFTGDMHSGARQFAKQEWLSLMDRIAKNPRAYAQIMGDLWDLVVFSDIKRMDLKCLDDDLINAEDLSDLPEAQYQLTIEPLRRIKDRIIGVHEGNHEKEMRKRHNRDMIARLCGELNIKNLSYIAYTRLVFVEYRKSARLDTGSVVHNSVKYRILSTHGKSGARTTGGKISYAESFHTKFEADIVAVGHTHERYIGASKQKLDLATTGNLQLVKRRKITTLTGSFLDNYTDGSSSYAEDAVYEPLEVGSPAIIFWPGRNKTEIVDNAMDVL